MSHSLPILPQETKATTRNLTSHSVHFPIIRRSCLECLLSSRSRSWRLSTSLVFGTRVIQRRRVDVPLRPPFYRESSAVSRRWIDLGRGSFLSVSITFTVVEPQFSLHSSSSQPLIVSTTPSISLHSLSSLALQHWTAPQRIPRLKSVPFLEFTAMPITIHRPTPTTSLSFVYQRH